MALSACFDHITCTFGKKLPQILDPGSEKDMFPKYFQKPGFGFRHSLRENRSTESKPRTRDKITHYYLFRLLE